MQDIQNNQAAALSTHSLTISQSGYSKAVSILDADMAREVGGHTRLLPPHVCHVLIAKHESPDLTPMGKEKARQSVLLLLSSYANGLKTKDGGEVDRLAFMRQIEKVFEAFPEWAAMAVVDPLNGIPATNPQFLPSAGEIGQRLKYEVAKFQSYAVRARQHLAEARSREKEQALEAEIEKVPAENRAKAVADILAKLKFRRPANDE